MECSEGVVVDRLVKSIGVWGDLVWCAATRAGVPKVNTVLVLVIEHLNS